jgi:AraC-like DNA-binding protein
MPGGNKMNSALNIHLFQECWGEHAHNYLQILVPVQKTMHINIEDTEYDVTSQELCFIPEGMRHQCDFNGKMLALNFTEPPDIKDKALFNHPIIVPMQGQIIQLVDLIQAELKQNPESESVHYLYNYLYSKVIENQEPPSIRYIYEHYDLPITVNELAEIERYNVTYFNDWFKQKTGVSPGIYLRRTRVEKAKELLQETNFNVTSIALRVGYSSNATFTRAFKSITGTTPKAFRERRLTA